MILFCVFVGSDLCVSEIVAELGASASSPPLPAPLPPDGAEPPTAVDPRFEDVRQIQGDAVRVVRHKASGDELVAKTFDEIKCLK